MAPLGTGGAGGGGGSTNRRWDGDAARRRRQAEEMAADRGWIFDGVIEFERRRVQAERGMPSTPPHQDTPTAVPLHHRAAPSAAAQPAAAFLLLLPPSPPIPQALGPPPAPPPPGLPPNPAATPPRPAGVAPDFQAEIDADWERRLQEAHLHNQREMDRLERQRMEGLLPQNLREEAEF